RHHERISCAASRALRHGRPRARRRALVPGDRRRAGNLGRRGEITNVPGDAAPAPRADPIGVAAVIDFDDRRVRRAVQQAFEDEHRFIEGLDRDLWPRMRTRLQTPAYRLSILDWGLAAAIVVVTIIYPPLVLGVLYHL